MLVFLTAAALLVAFSAPFVTRGQNLFTVLAGFFIIGLLSVIAAVVPMGWAALPALGLREAGWRPIVFGALGTLALSVGVSQLAAGVSSLVFAAAHLEPTHILLVLPLGLLFGWLRWRTGSLLPSMVAHIVNNSFAVLASLLIAPD